jgi:ribulose-5-phosphate 4-epimerase/fuculose-1-phosphate aldolase
VLTLPATASHRLLSEAPALCQVISAIHQRGWCDGTGGNFSSVLCHDPLALLMAPSGVDKGALQPSDLIIVDGSGQVICGEGKASAETLLHLAIIRTTGAGAVLHTHSQAATLISQKPACAHASAAIQQSKPNLRQAPQADASHPLRPSPTPQTRGTNLRSVSPDPRAAPSNLQNSAADFLNISRGPQTPERTPQEPLPGEETETPPAFLGYLRLADLEMVKGLEGIRSHTTPIAIPILANSQDMRQLSLAALPHLATAPYGLLIAGHGLYAWGNALPQARRHLEILEFLLEQHWRQSILNALLRTENTPQ